MRFSMIFVLSSQNQKPKTEPKSSLSDSDILLQSLHYSKWRRCWGAPAPPGGTWVSQRCLVGGWVTSWPSLRRWMLPSTVSWHLHRPFCPESNQNPYSNNNIGFGFEFPSFSMELMAVPKRKVPSHFSLHFLFLFHFNE